MSEKWLPPVFKLIDTIHLNEADKNRFTKCLASFLILFSCLSLLLFFFFGCQPPTSLKSLNQSLSNNDTLILNTQRVISNGMFGHGVGSIHLRDTSEDFQYPVVFPKNILEPKRAQFPTNPMAKEIYFVDIISGFRNEEEIFIVDENNNKDFRDDSVRVWQAIDWSSAKTTIKCLYNISDGHNTKLDSSWIRIGISFGRKRIGRHENLLAHLELEENQYQFKIIDQHYSSTFVYGLKPEIALASKNGVAKDTILQKDRIYREEYIMLNDKHYRFDSISILGDQVFLVKEKDFAKKIGTQIGMIAPPFNVITTSGDTINSVNLVDKPIVLANSCGCGGDKESPQAFYDIRKTFGDKIYTIRLDSGIKNEVEGWQIDTEKEYNRDIFNQYRKEYCSRIAYVIGKEARIIEKFDIKDWKSVFPSLLE